MIERHKRRRRRVRTAVLAEFRWTKSQAMFELPLDWADGTGMGPGLVGYLLTHLLTVVALLWLSSIQQPEYR